MKIKIMLFSIFFSCLWLFAWTLTFIPNRSWMIAPALITTTIILIGLLVCAIDKKTGKKKDNLD